MTYRGKVGKSHGHYLQINSYFVRGQPGNNNNPETKTNFTPAWTPPQTSKCRQTQSFQKDTFAQTILTTGDHRIYLSCLASFVLWTVASYVLRRFYSAFNNSDTLNPTNGSLNNIETDKRHAILEHTGAGVKPTGAALKPTAVLETHRRCSGVHSTVCSAAHRRCCRARRRCS